MSESGESSKCYFPYIFLRIQRETKIIIDLGKGSDKFHELTFPNYYNDDYYLLNTYSEPGTCRHFTYVISIPCSHPCNKHSFSHIVRKEATDQ